MAPFFLWMSGIADPTAFAGPASSMTANAGVYSNWIQNVTLATDFMEICWVGGVRQVEQHPGGGSTVGGACTVGTRGFVIETVERPAAVWYLAKETCTALDMRLPEVFEFALAHEVATAAGIAGFSDDNEVASNTIMSAFRVPFMGPNGPQNINEGDTVNATPFHCVL